jgi:hypothetical protein
MTALSVVLTCCPPAPDARVALSLSSSSSMLIDYVTRISGIAGLP